MTFEGHRREHQINARKNRGRKTKEKRWQVSYLSKYELFETGNDGYTLQRRAFVVKTLDDKFQGVIKTEKYGAPYSEYRLKKVGTFDEAWANLKKFLHY